MSIMKYIIAFGLGFVISTAISVNTFSDINKFVSDYCECKPK